MSPKAPRELNALRALPFYPVFEDGKAGGVRVSRLGGGR